MVVPDAFPRLTAEPEPSPVARPCHPSRPWERIANERQSHRGSRPARRRSRRCRRPGAGPELAQLEIGDDLPDVDGHHHHGRADGRRERQPRGGDDYELAFGETPQATSGTSSATSTSSSTTSAASSASAATRRRVGVDGHVTWPVTAVNVAIGDIVKAGDVLAVADTTTAARRDPGGGEPRGREGTAPDRSRRRDLRFPCGGEGPGDEREDQLSNARASYSSTVAQGNSSSSMPGSRWRTQGPVKRDRKAHAPAATIRQDKAAITPATEPRLHEAPGPASNRQAASQVTSAKHSMTPPSAATTARPPGRRRDDRRRRRRRRPGNRPSRTPRRRSSTRRSSRPSTARHGGQRRQGRRQHGHGHRAPIDPARAQRQRGRGRHPRVKVGQPATMTISATGGTATGNVTSVDPVAATSGSSTVVTYTVVVTLDEAPARRKRDNPAATDGTPSSRPAAGPPRPRARPPSAAATEPLSGMSADITIVIAKARTPSPSPRSPCRAPRATTRSASSAATAPSRPGRPGRAHDHDLAQITSGVNAGETVVTGTSADRTSTSSSTPNGGDSRRRLPASGGRFPEVGGRSR